MLKKKNFHLIVRLLFILRASSQKTKKELRPLARRYHSTMANVIKLDLSRWYGPHHFSEIRGLCWIKFSTKMLHLFSRIFEYEKKILKKYFGSWYDFVITIWKFQKQSFLGVLLEHFIKYKPLFSEERPVSFIWINNTQRENQMGQLQKMISSRTCKRGLNKF